MFKHILVAVDGSATANRGLSTAIELAADQRATLHVLHVVDDLAAMPAVNEGFIPADYIEGMIESLREGGRQVVAKANALAGARGIEVKTLLVESRGRSVAETILAQARRQKADLIVLGTHGRRGLRRVLLGSDAENVLRDARIPVLLVRGTERAKRPAARNAKASKSARAAKQPEKRTPALRLPIA